MKRIGLFGVTGYTGRELRRLLAMHPDIETTFATGSGHLDHELGLEREADAYLLALPHGIAARFADTLRGSWPNAVVIDLSGDLRLPSAESYRTWYGTEHAAPALLGHVPYGLTEINRKQLGGAKLISNPGCYATSVLLPSLPLLREQLVSPNGIIVDSKSGASGAGRAAREALLFCEVDEDLKAYSPGHQHRHVGEIEAVVQQHAGCEISLTFCPHLLPVKRGILSSLYFRSETPPEQLVAALRSTYAGEPFVRIVEKPPRLQDVVYTNECHISVHAGASGNVIVFSALDNLVKGAAGQAIQNLNLALGLPEKSGLPVSLG